MHSHQGFGYDARWYGLPISSVGGCHGRFRVFIAAYPAGDPWWLSDGDGGPAGVTASGLPLLPTPGANLGYNGGPQHPDKRRDGGHTVSLEDAVHGLTLLPTPSASNPNDGEPVESWLARRERVKLTAQNGNGMGIPLSIAVQLLPTPRSSDGFAGPDYARASRAGSGGDDLVTTLARLLPTPRASDGTKGGPNQRGSSGDLGGEIADRFGEYAAAIASHEALTGRPAPEPTEPGPKGRLRLSARFAEWMMTLPDGWVADVPGLTLPQQLHAIGNGVAPLQAVAGLQVLGNRNLWA